MSDKGVKLPYFHRTLTPEDAALIGDTRPKPIGGDGAATASNSSGKVTERSAWNGAQTWEERNCTEWGKEKLRSLFSNDRLTAAGYNVTIKSLTKVEGNAQITHSRGKARFMYEWTLTVDFEAVSSETFKGSAVCSDVINDQLDDIEIELTWSGKKPAHSDTKIVRDVIKMLVVNKMKEFEEAYRNIDS